MSNKTKIPTTEEWIKFHAYETRIHNLALKLRKESENRPKQGFRADIDRAISER